MNKTARVWRNLSTFAPVFARNVKNMIKISKKQLPPSAQKTEE